MNIFELDQSLRGPKKSIAENSDQNGWYVLDTKNRKIIANDVSKERASAIAKSGGYTMWQTENGTFINSSRTVRYPGLGWIDVSEDVTEGYRVVPGIDRERYTERSGLEGPFHAKNGKVVYYDKREGKYYDPDSDFYISHDDWQAMNEQDVAKATSGKVEAYGYAYNNRDQRVMWRKIFPSAEAAHTWADKKNATVLGTRAVEQAVKEADDEKIAGRYEPEDFDAMVQRVGAKAKEQQKRHPVDIADLARRMRALDQRKPNTGK